MILRNGSVLIELSLVGL